jgi:hypothetical protein
MLLLKVQQGTVGAQDENAEHALRGTQTSACTRNLFLCKIRVYSTEVDNQVMPIPMRPSTGTSCSRLFPAATFEIL